MKDPLFGQVMAFIGPNAKKMEVAWAMGCESLFANRSELIALKALANANTFEECIKVFLEENDESVSYRALSKALRNAKTAYQCKMVWSYSDSAPQRVEAIRLMVQFIKKENGVWSNLK